MNDWLKCWHCILNRNQSAGIFLDFDIQNFFSLYLHARILFLLISLLLIKMILYNLSQNQCFLYNLFFWFVKWHGNIKFIIFFSLEQNFFVIYLHPLMEISFSLLPSFFCLHPFIISFFVFFIIFFTFIFIVGFLKLNVQLIVLVLSLCLNPVFPLKEQRHPSQNILLFFFRKVLSVTFLYTFYL